MERNTESAQAKKSRRPATQREFNEGIVTALQEIVSCLCYQPEFPLTHKQDMAERVNEVAMMKVQ